jgi:catechol 2,3-dioxygenase
LTGHHERHFRDTRRIEIGRFDNRGSAIQPPGFLRHRSAAHGGFLQKALRFTQTDSGDLGPVQLVFLSCDPREHHQIVLASGRPADAGFNPLDQLSFRVDSLAALRKYPSRLVAEGATDVQAVTHSNAVSVYCRDPDGNRIEIFIDIPWYCTQPLREPVDLTLGDDAIMAETEARRYPNFMRREQWQSDVARRMQEDQRDGEPG